MPDSIKTCGVRMQPIERMTSRLASILRVLPFQVELDLRRPLAEHDPPHLRAGQHRQVRLPHHRVEIAGRDVDALAAADAQIRPMAQPPTPSIIAPFWSS